MMSRHNFIESSGYKYNRVIFCGWCGLVTWDYNKNEKTEMKQSDLQGKVGKPCVGGKSDG